MTAGWGEAGDASESEHIPGEVDLGNGNRLVFNPAAFRKLLHSAEAVNAVTKRAQEICDSANQLVALDPRTVERVGDGEPDYKVEVHNNPDETRVQGRVLPNNFLGALDNGHNLTLMKAVDGHPSDPRGSHHD